MATSWTLTRQQLAAAVLRKLGVLADGATATAADLAVVYEALDARLKSLHTLGVLWWKVATVATDLNLTANNAAAALPTDFLMPVSIKLRDTEDLPVEIMPHQDYQAIPDKTETGVPDRVAFGVANAYFYPTPQTTYVAKLTYQKIVDDSADGVAPDIIVAGLRALKMMIAYDCADDFEVPEQKIMRLAAEAKQAERDLITLKAPITDNQPTAAQYF